MSEPRHTVDTITSDQLDALQDDLARLRESHGSACQTIARMHAAAIGMGFVGPIRGLVEDVSDVRERAEQAEAAIARVRALHRKASHGDMCVYCAPVQRIGYDATWPCDTIRALDEPKEQPAPGRHLPVERTSSSCPACLASLNPPKEPTP